MAKTTETARSGESISDNEVISKVYDCFDAVVLAVYSAIETPILLDLARNGLAPFRAI